jgi:hypothetical protein
MTEKTNPVLTVDVEGVITPAPATSVLVVPCGDGWRVTARLSDLTEWLMVNLPVGQTTPEVLANASYATLGRAFRVGSHAAFKQTTHASDVLEDVDL